MGRLGHTNDQRTRGEILHKTILTQLIRILLTTPVDSQLLPQQTQPHPEQQQPLQQPIAEQKATEAITILFGVLLKAV